MVVAEILDQGVELVVGNYDAQLAVALLFKGGGGEQPGDLFLQISHIFCILWCEML